MASQRLTGHRVPCVSFAPSALSNVMAATRPIDRRLRPFLRLPAKAGIYCGRDASGPFDTPSPGVTAGDRIHAEDVARLVDRVNAVAQIDVEQLSTSQLTR